MLRNSTPAERIVQEINKKCYGVNCWLDPTPIDACVDLCKEQDVGIQVEIIRTLFSEISEVWKRPQDFSGSKSKQKKEYDERVLAHCKMILIERVCNKPVFTAPEHFISILMETIELDACALYRQPHIKPLLRAIDRRWDVFQDNDELRSLLSILSSKLIELNTPDEVKVAINIERMLNPERHLPLFRGEAWSDAAIDAIESMDDARRDAFRAVMIHAGRLTAGKPSAKWKKEAAVCVERAGEERLRGLLVEWFALVDKPRTRPLERTDWRTGTHGDQLLLDHHSDVLKGLCWMASFSEDADMARALGELALSCYRKLPGIGPRAVKVGNAAVNALGAMPGRAAIGQLAVMRIKLKFATAQKLLTKALDATAERERLPRDEIEEMAVPSYGLEEVGRVREMLGEYQACIEITGSSGASSAGLGWINPAGKALKSVPAAVKRDFPGELKELKKAVADIKKMIPIQKDRIDGLFLERRTWAFETWRERYLDHPLIGTIARRMIWVFGSGEEETSAMWLRDDPEGAAYGAGRLVRVDGSVFEAADAAVEVRLWHPIRETAGAHEEALRPDVLEWRCFLEDNRITQPFKQAHREVYLLTEAERQTGVYSNRFAAHVIRQHQFNALCGQRSWKNQLRIMADMECHAPRRDLGAWGLRAEFWVEGIGDDYVEEYVLESGAFRYLTTDQVRFYQLEASQNFGHVWGGRYTSEGEDVPLNHPLPLDQIPPIVLSEILRDVDLFVGVSSVGNNPAWSDGGPEGAFRDYWSTYSFGDLSGSAQSRRDLLTRLIPRLNIADRCEVGAKYLVVRGDLRVYKIHLGSGNILMEPNDQYLCIVPDNRMAADGGSKKVYLPFEGDRTLAVILSKAFLLAEDTKIKDKTILSQIC